MKVRQEARNKEDRLKMNIDNFFGINVLLHQERAPRVIQPRTDPRDTMTEREFKKHFRFSKETVTGIAQSLEQDLSSADNRGLPLSPEIKVYIVLGIYGGPQFL